MKSGCVYLMANRRRGQTYLGVTSNLPQRAWQHRNGIVEGHAGSRDALCLSGTIILMICRMPVPANIG